MHTNSSCVYKKGFKSVVLKYTYVRQLYICSILICMYKNSILPCVSLDSTAGNGVLTKATVPIYATGVLTCYIQVGLGFCFFVKCVIVCKTI